MTDTEQNLARLWTELLHAPVTSGDASFWKLGGHSLLGVQLVAAIREQFAVDMRLRDPFRHPGLSDLAAFLDAAGGAEAGGDATPGAPAGDRRELPASSLQHRIWLAEKLQPEVGLYHVPLARRVSGRLASERLASALARVVERHEALRTTFVERDGALWQIVRSLWTPVIQQDLCEDEVKLTEQLRTEADRPFDLAAGPLLGVGLIDTPDAQILTMTAHHIVFDVASVSIVLDELDRWYAEDPGPAEPAPRQFRDFVVASDNRSRGAPPHSRTPAGRRPSWPSTWKTGSVQRLSRRRGSAWGA